MPKKSPNVVVVGNSCVDIWIGGDERLFTGSSRIAWPRPGERLVVDMSEALLFPGGNGCNVALGLARHGCSTTLLTALGEDESAKMLYNVFKSYGVYCRNIVTSERSSSTAHSLIISQGGDPSYVVVAGASGEMGAEHIRVGIESIREMPDAFLVVGLGIMPVLDKEFYRLYSSLDALAGKGVLTFMDVNLLSEEGARAVYGRDTGGLLERFDYIAPNAAEARMLVRSAGEPVGDSAGDVARALLRLGVRKGVAVKCGDSGCVFASREHGVFEVEAEKIATSEVVDAVGAGDSWLAGFASVVVADPDGGREMLVRAVTEGNHSGASCVRSRGGTGWLERGEAK